MRILLSTYRRKDNSIVTTSDERYSHDKHFLVGGLWDNVSITYSDHGNDSPIDRGDVLIEKIMRYIIVINPGFVDAQLVFESTQKEEEATNKMRYKEYS